MKTIIILFFFCLSFCSCLHKDEKSLGYKSFADSLLLVWSDAMLEWQVHDVTNPERDGAIFCHGCNKIHGRCMDAVYPFLYMADKTGERKYLDAAIAVMKWSENVSAEDGSWTVIPDPESWKGITVFGAISLAEALHYHGHLLPAELKRQWDERLRQAGEYIYNNFTLTFTNINYGISAIYAMHLIGNYLYCPKYIEKSKELRMGIEECFTQTDLLLYGEGKPYDKVSAKGLRFIDLGYNVEETLNALVLYAIDSEDKELQDWVIRSLQTHLEFMLPDGGWDNSWGTRQYKWTYWGSRTTEGCFASYGLLSMEEPAFAAATFLNTLLLKKCTSNKYGLLCGGMHYDSHGIIPCVHHTFTHAKALVTLLNRGVDFKQIYDNGSLPRLKSNGIKKIPEISTWLISEGDWRATVSSYDAIYAKGVQQATGGSLALLYHNKAGLLMSASMAEYKMVEVNNQQPNPGGTDFALTPRIEVIELNGVFSNLYDLRADVTVSEKSGLVVVDVKNSLKDKTYNSPVSGEILSQVQYVFSADSFQYVITQVDGASQAADLELILPIVCSSFEKCTQLTPHEIVIYKNAAVVRIISEHTLSVKCDVNQRFFNMVPGVEALPVYVAFSGKSAKVTIAVE